MQRLVLSAAICLAGCGLASVQPIVTDADARYDARLVGTWQDSAGKESATIASADAGGYRVVYMDEKGKTGRFSARLGRLGAVRVLDLWPDDPIPEANDFYKSLVLRAHAILVIDSIGAVLTFRALETDSLKALLRRQPGAVPHTMIDDTILLTGSSAQVREFLATFLRGEGVLTESTGWNRRRGS